MADELRVLQVVPALSKESGVMRYTWNMMREASANGIVFDYLYHISDTLTFEEECLEQGSRIYRVPNAAENIAAYVRGVNAIIAKTGQEHPIIHCHVPNSAFCVLKAAKREGVRHRLLHSHLAASSEHLFHRFRNYPLIKYGRRFSTVNLACSKEAGNYLFGEGAYDIFPNGIDIDQYRYDRDEGVKLKEQLLTDKTAFPVIGCVGRLAKQKNYPFMIEVFKQLLSIAPNSELVIAGDGPERRSVEVLVSDASLGDRVHLLGARDDVNKLYSVMDVFVMPSLCEGLPIAAVEAQAAGLHCVFSDDVSSQSDLTGTARFLSREDSHDFWARAILDAAGEKRGVEFPRLVEQAGYSSASSAQRLVKLYLSLVR